MRQSRLHTSTTQHPSRASEHERVILGSSKPREPYELTEFVMRDDMTGLPYDTPIE